MSPIYFPFLPNLWVLVPATVALVALWVWAYRWTRSVTGARTRWLLTAARVVVTLLIVGCICHPIYREFQKTKQRSVVAVLIDASKSMSIPDMPRGRKVCVSSGRDQGNCCLK